MSQGEKELLVELKSSLKKFAAEKMLPYLNEDEENHYFRPEIYTGLGELGLTGMTLPENYGGLATSFPLYASMLAELAGYSVSYAVTLSVSSMVQGIILQSGSEKQKSHYLPALTSGESIGAFALTESQSGSDASSLRTKYRETDKGYVLSGRKMFITSGGIAGVYVVFARAVDAPETGSEGISAFLVDQGTPGLEYGKAEKKMGWKISPTRELIFDHCLIPKDALIGLPGKGFRVAMTGLDKGRVGIASIAVGVAEKALAECLHYSKQREQFQKAISEFQGIQFMLSEMATEIAASKYLVEEAARCCENLSPQTTLLAAMAKLKATDTAMQVTTDAVQIFGGVGITEEYPVERLMRDSKILQIVEGTNQIQRMVIAKNLLK